MMCNIIIKENKDRKQNPYHVCRKDISMEDDYSEESNANSVCLDFGSFADKAQEIRYRNERLIR